MWLIKPPFLQPPFLPILLSLVGVWTIYQHLLLLANLHFNFKIIVDLILLKHLLPSKILIRAYFCRYFVFQDYHEENFTLPWPHILGLWLIYSDAAHSSSSFFLSPSTLFPTIRNIYLFKITCDGNVLYYSTTNYFLENRCLTHNWSVSSVQYFFVALA